MCCEGQYDGGKCGMIISHTQIHVQGSEDHISDIYPDHGKPYRVADGASLFRIVIAIDLGCGYTAEPIQVYQHGYYHQGYCGTLIQEH